MKTNKTCMNTRVVNEKATTYVVPNIGTSTMVINNNMVVIQDKHKYN
jgi:hypothetical protein